MINGILAVWKPRGMTSHDVVFKMRKLFKMKKIGHTGTLDPQVDGVLVLCLGKATKLVQILTDSTKQYIGEITLGYSTETEDAYGEVVETKPVTEIIPTSKIDLAMIEMEGELVQIPPMYSAVKVDGRRLYEYARKGESVERPTRNVTIYSFKRTSKPILNLAKQTQTWKFTVKCGKGTYVRTLAVDLGEKLGFPAHMSDLTRTETSGITLKDTLTIEEIEKAISDQNIELYIKSIEEVLSDYPTITLDEDEDARKVSYGQVFSPDYFGPEILKPTALSYNNEIIGIYYPHPTKENLIKPYIMFK